IRYGTIASWKLLYHALMRTISLAMLSLLSGAARDGEILDPDTLAWWHTTAALSGDDMEGRDTGSPAYQRAADYDAKRIKAADLWLAGDNGSYYQYVQKHEIAASQEGNDFALVRPDGSQTKLRFREEISYQPEAGLPAHLEGALTFRGYCGRGEMDNIAGKIVVCFGNRRDGLPDEGARIDNAVAGRALAIVNVDDPYFTLEPPRWPAAYARKVSLRPQGSTESFCVMRLSADAFASVVKDGAELLKDGGAQKPLPSFDFPGKLQVHTRQVVRDISSPNVLGVLPGTDPNHRNEYVVVSAHLDGYGFGTPVNGDNLYNGTLDDAAYVALLVQLADDIRSHKLPAPRRSILFAAFTGVVIG